MIKIDLRTAGAFWNIKPLRPTKPNGRRLLSGELILSLTDVPFSLALGDSFQFGEQGDYAWET